MSPGSFDVSILCNYIEFVENLWLKTVLQISRVLEKGESTKSCNNPGDILEGWGESLKTGWNLEVSFPNWVYQVARQAMKSSKWRRHVYVQKCVHEDTYGMRASGEGALRRMFSPYSPQFWRFHFWCQRLKKQKFGSNKEVLEKVRLVSKE